jgi:hypothetical protein
VLLRGPGQQRNDKEHPDRCLFAVFPFVAIQPLEVEVHLPGITRREPTDLEINRDQPPLN